MIAVAVGSNKSTALRGALRTGLIDDLVTDAETIEETLRLAGVTFKESRLVADLH